MTDNKLELWKQKMEDISSSPNCGDVCRMLWEGEWRYYRYLDYTNKNGKMWERVTKKEYKDFRVLVEKTKHITLADLLRIYGIEL